MKKEDGFDKIIEELEEEAINNDPTLIITDADIKEAIKEAEIGDVVKCKSIDEAC